MDRFQRGGDHPLSDAQRLQRLVEVAQQKGEFVASEASHRVAFPNAVRESLGHREQHRVAALVAEPVVDRLEVVEIAEQHGDVLAGSGAAPARWRCAGERQCGWQGRSAGRWWQGRPSRSPSACVPATLRRWSPAPPGPAGRPDRRAAHFGARRPASVRRRHRSGSRSPASAGGVVPDGGVGAAQHPAGVAREAVQQRARALGLLRTLRRIQQRRQPHLVLAGAPHRPGSDEHGDGGDGEQRERPERQ